MSDTLTARVREAFAASRQRLLSERVAAGHWEGHLSSSALSTATAVLALLKSPGGAARHEALVGDALEWLASTQLESGGLGDTPVSRPNIATTLLCWAAFGLAGGMEGMGSQFEKTVQHCEAWICQESGGLSPENLAAALTKRYGKDKTFAVPILMACAIGGRLGPEPDCWRLVSALPFELAALPREWFAALKLPVVSYALPALIAIGQVRHHHAPAWRPWRWIRQAAAGRTLRLLREIQPAGGGFLEATPLTAFVSMALSSAGQGGSETTREANEFLLRSVRPDGSWPIDTNLATWGTTLSIKALGNTLPPESAPGLLAWLLNQQYKTRHPYCMSPPGGWAWTDLPGGVPDADDTAGALLALRKLITSASCGGEPINAERKEPEESSAASTHAFSENAAAAAAAASAAGMRWLTGLQNGDGGMPTFCKGWGALPFDRSAPDLTAHALAAWQAWRQLEADVPEMIPAMRRAVDFLARTQRADGAWLPLWFGNEWQADESNPVFGTATVLKYLTALPASEFPALPTIRAKAADYLLKAQSANGTWAGGTGESGPASIEETATALEALTLQAATSAAAVNLEPDENSSPGALSAALTTGTEALLSLTQNGTSFPATPIGLYFARLWYHEKLYPIIAATSAFRVLAKNGARD